MAISKAATSAPWMRAASAKIVDRKKETWCWSAASTCTNEVEDVVAQMPGVLECAVVGVPMSAHGRSGEAGHRAQRSAPERSRCEEYCRANLTGYKQPKVIEFTELPKTPVGKILRRELRDKK